ncbi:NAD(P)/FAD-dependent oxidoreductase [Micromonospora sp. RTGN7]|uniref:NAD(P)/FAD-dependent oxidoreductase n=1 Tax=Micromonospora sp. RTGN7 TaxID=3016526 RepID=UPI0029FF1458|nr:NAD(P)/FAD-dependent oxidoreductase [Micromonospora sp. RTGN7]
MVQELGAYYDVIIMGGGPAGSTLAAQLARTSNLSVAILEKVTHPREHIGESLAHPTTPALEEIGALEKMMASDFWVQKFGGIFNWDSAAEGPAIGFFDHESYQQDGVHRWAGHVNRADFDHMLLQHAAESGAQVFEEHTVSDFERLEDGCLITLNDGRTVRCGYFVDASGRRNSIASKKKRDYLSGYKNIAIWQHYVGATHSYEIDEDWNIFHPEGRSPITCSAFSDGWCWYIPVPKTIDGKRVVTHSVGIVTIPAILKEEGKDFTDIEVFTKAIKGVPLIGDLVKDAKPISDKMVTATNYSMINDRFCDFDERWILIGDAAYFVDPLFSSGVAFAMHHGLSAATVLKATFDKNVDEQHKRDLWRDYDQEWHGIAESFSLSIDQWYHSIGKGNPDSIYWRTRGQDLAGDIREQTFQILLSTTMEPDLLRVMTNEDGKELDAEGPYMKAYQQAASIGLSDDDLISLAPGALMRPSLALDIPGFKGFVPPLPVEIPTEEREAITRYWSDPVANGSAVVSPLSHAVPCYRFSVEGAPDGLEVRSIDAVDGGSGVWKCLQEGPVRYAELQQVLSEVQLHLLRLLARAGVVTVERATVQVG